MIHHDISKNTNDTDYNDTDYIKTENNDMDDLNDKKSTYPSNHTNHSNDNSNFNNEALKFHYSEELPQSIQNYLSNFEVAEIKLIKSVLLKAKTSFNNSIDALFIRRYGI